MPCAKCQLNLNWFGWHFLFCAKENSLERYLVDILPDEGLHGRRVITTNEQKITADNVVKVLNTAIATHERNRGEIQYLWDVYRGKQDIRKKKNRP